jgi:hypothetical protein
MMASLPTSLVAAATVAPFQTLAELRREHADLLKLTRSEDRPANLQSRIAQFLARCQATGTRLDAPEDRESVQGILDYWTASFFTQTVTSTNILKSASSNFEASRASAAVSPGSLVLAEFDQESSVGTADAAEQALDSLTPADQDLARQILLSLVRLVPDGRTFELTSASRAVLETHGSPVRVKTILDKLIAAGVIKVNTGADPENAFFFLQSEALTRTWFRLSLWMEQRVRFRDAAKYWDKQNRNSAAYISGQLLDEARGYHDLNELERLYVKSSRTDELRVRRALWVWVAILAVVSIGALCGWMTAHYSELRARKAGEELEEKNKDLIRAEAQLTSANIDLKKEKQVRENKQRLGNMALLTRALSEVATARNSAERTIALRRWEILSQNLKQDDTFFATFLNTRQDEITSAMKNASSRAGFNRVAREALNVGRQLKNEALSLDDPDVSATLKSMRAISYGTARLCAEQIVENFATHPYANAEAYLKEFWTLYWGELAILEGPRVEKGIVEFGKQLDTIDRAMEQRISPELKSAEGDGTRKVPQIRGFWQKTNQLQSSPDGSAEASHSKQTALRKKVADDQLVELRRILNSDLIPALQAELDHEQLAPNKVLPTAY